MWSGLERILVIYSVVGVGWLVVVDEILFVDVGVGFV